MSPIYKRETEEDLVPIMPSPDAVTESVHKLLQPFSTSMLSDAISCGRIEHMDKTLINRIARFKHSIHSIPEEPPLTATHMATLKKARKILSQLSREIWLSSPQNPEAIKASLQIEKSADQLQYFIARQNISAQNNLFSL